MKNYISILLFVTIPYFALTCEIPQEDCPTKSDQNNDQNGLSSKSIDNYDFMVNISFKENTNRYITVDPKSTTSPLNQIIEQAIQIYANRKIYFLEQKEFLEQIIKKSSGSDTDPTQKFNPLFDNMVDQRKRKILIDNIRTYEATINASQKVIDEIFGEKNDFSSLFEHFVRNRLLVLSSRSSRRDEGVNLPSTKPEAFDKLSKYDKFVALEAITNFRILDEIIYALYPYQKKSDLHAVNEKLTHEKTAIIQDLPLMQFLAGDIQIPKDPDTVWSLRELKGKIREIYDPYSNRYISIVIPVIPKNYRDLFDILLKKLENGNTDDSFLPNHVKNFIKQQQHNKKKLTGKKKQHSTTQETMVHPVIHQQNPEQVSSPTSEPVDKTLDNQDIYVSTAQIKSVTPRLEHKPTKPEGGWSLRDQQRSIEAKGKALNVPSASTFCSSNATAIKFQPTEPITLSSGQYNTLQEILDETSPAYTLTFDRVRDLLEGLGIRVERNGGSHAHIYTPGHNIKTLVDIHYGWTDKFGKGTMASLRTLMQNLGLDNPENVRVNQQGL